MMNIRATSIINENWRLSIFVIGEKDQKYDYMINNKKINVIEVNKNYTKKRYFFKNKILSQLYNIIELNSKICHLIKSNEIDLLYTMNQPHILHIHGIIAKIRKKIFWVSEFRDPLSQNSILIDKGSYSSFIYSKLENLIIQFSDIIITYKGLPMDPTYFYKKYNKMKNKIFVLPYMGLSKVEYISKSRKYANKYVITFGGMIYDGTLEVFKNLFSAIYNINNDKILLNFIGNDDNKKLNKLIVEHNLYNKVVIKGQVKIEDYLELLNASDILLYIIPLSKGYQFSVSLKTWDYINARRPILALVPSDWEFAKLVHDYKLGYVVDPNNVHEIGEIIINIIKDIENDEVKYSPPENIYEVLDNNLSEKAFVDIIKQSVSPKIK